MRLLRHRGLETKIAACPQVVSELTGPIVERRIQMLRGQHGLREHIPEGGAQAAARRVHVALAAFQTHLHGEIGLGVRAAGRETQPKEQAVQSQAGMSADHCADSTVNSNEVSAPRVSEFMLANAPPPAPRSVTR